MAGGSIRKIVVAVDASADSLAALEAAVRLAVAVDAEVTGVFVEDERLLGAARSAFAQEVDFLSGELRRLHPGGLQRQLQSDARRAREVLRRSAERLGVPWSFRTLRGRPDTELRSLAEQADVITVGVRGRSLGRGPGSTARFLVAGVGIRVLVVRQGRRLAGAVHVLHDGTEEADRALETGLGLERADRRGVVVLSLGADRDALRERLAQATVPARIRELEPAAPVEAGGDEAAGPREGEPAWRKGAPSLEERLELELTQARAGLLVASRSTLENVGADLGRLLSRGPCPVLVVG